MTGRTPWPGGGVGRTVISVGSKEPAFSGQGVYVDGHTATARVVPLSFDDGAGALVIHPHAADPIHWPYRDLRAVPDQAGAEGMVLARAGDGAARLEVNLADATLIRTRAFHLARRVTTVKRGKLALLASAAVASVALMIAVLVPNIADRLATYLPPEGEVALGEATLGHLRVFLSDARPQQKVPFCLSPAGVMALDEMVTTLSAQAPEFDGAVTVHVLDHPMVNAFALPGGIVVLFRGLIEAAEAPEEIAAVLAHEIGHVQARDPTRIALRSAGSIGVLGLLFGDFAGGAIVTVLAERIIQADYTQDAEAAADAYGVRVLQGAGLPPEALAQFFERLQESGAETSAILQHFQSHPALADRIAAARATAAGSATQTPVLTADQWAALQAICT